MALPLFVAGGVSLLLRSLATWAGVYLAQALAAVGLYFFIAEPGTDLVMEYMQDQFDLVTGTVYETLMYCNVDDFVGMCAAGLAYRVAMNASVQLRGRRSKATTGAPS